MAANITCKNCGNVIEISEALTESIVASERAKYQKTELELRKKANDLEEKNRNFELILQRQLDSERNLIRQKAAEEFAISQRIKDLEKDKIVSDLKKSLEDAQRKANQSSQQLQGEVQELDLEETLKINFPGDEILPIAKGVNGADIKHLVKSPKVGIDCGNILWESKRTKAWSDGWLAKLKEDLRTEKASVAAIVSEALPESLRKSGIGLVDGIWVCEPKLAVALGMLLAKALKDASYQRLVSQNQSDKATQVYAYFTSHEFTHQVEAMMDAVSSMREQIAKEKSAFERIWASREAQIGKLVSGVSGVYGSIQGLSGNALPAVKQLELET
jgi:hypothetical protein